MAARGIIRLPQAEGLRKAGCSQVARCDACLQDTDMIKMIKINFLDVDHKAQAIEVCLRKKAPRVLSGPTAMKSCQPSTISVAPVGRKVLRSCTAFANKVSLGMASEEQRRNRQQKLHGC